MVAIVAEPFPSFRPLQEVDLDAVAAIEFAAYDFPWTRGIFADCLRAGYDCWVLARPAEIVGYGILSFGAGEAHLLNVCVAPAEQRRGYGRRIVLRMIELARWHRAERMFLEVRSSNRGAAVLYESIGFNEVGRRPHYYPARRGREDAIVMAMELLPTAI